MRAPFRYRFEAGRMMDDERGVMNGESSGTKLKVYSSVLPSQLMINWACHVEQCMVFFFSLSFLNTVASVTTGTHQVSASAWWLGTASRVDLCLSLLANCYHSLEGGIATSCFCMSGKYISTCLTLWGAPEVSFWSIITCITNEFKWLGVHVYFKKLCVCLTCFINRINWTLHVTKKFAISMCFGSPGWRTT